MARLADMQSFILEKVQQLSDLDLAILVSLVSGHHCILSSDVRIVKDLCHELRLTCSETFGMQTALVNCSGKTTVDDFNESLLVDVIDNFEDAREYRHGSRMRSPAVNNLRVPSHSPSRTGRIGSLNNELDDRRIANVVIATNLDLATPSVQVQALELLRTRRIFTRTSMHSAPRNFLLVVVLSEPGARLSHHLNDMFALSHFHAEEDGFPHLEKGTFDKPNFTNFSDEEVKYLRESVKSVNMTGEIREYLHNIAIFMRMSRYVKGGVTATSTLR